MEDIGSGQKFSGSFFTPLLISLAGIVGSSAAIVAYHVLLVKFCRQRRAGSSRLQSNRPAAQGQGIIGVEEHVLKAIPIYCYDESSTETTNDHNDCVICLGELKQGDYVRLLPYCRHLFHLSCIDDWFLAHTSCPICRAPIVAPISSVIHVPVVTNARGDHGDADHGDHGGGHGANDHYSSTSRDTRRLLQHSVSLVLPREGKSSERHIGLKRSLSMDQCYVAIDIKGEISDQKASCICSSSASKGRSYGARSMRQLDRIMSSRLLRSFSQLRIGGRGTTSSSNAILPY